jgi:AbrB family looped-hinge helix DNA binding protein
MKTIVSEKGQVTIPKALRDRLGIRPGEVLEVREEAGRLVATKQSAEDAVDRVYGILKPRRRTDRLMDALRGKPDAV